jgi:hypothetical protein
MRLFEMTAEGRETDIVLTPPDLFEVLAIDFDLDVAAAVDGDFVPASRRLTIVEDGLVSPWQGRVWMNPPYSEPAPWVRRFIDHGHGIALLPVSRARWQIELWQRADAIALPDIPFSFWRHNGFSFAVSLSAFGDECVEAIGRWGRAR